MLLYTLRFMNRYEGGRSFSLSKDINGVSFKKRIRLWRSMVIARGLVFGDTGENIRLVNKHGDSLVVTSEYLRGVKQLDPKRRTQHIEWLSKKIRGAKQASIYQSAK